MAKLDARALAILDMVAAGEDEKTLNGMTDEQLEEALGEHLTANAMRYVRRSMVVNAVRQSKARMVAPDGQFIVNDEDEVEMVDPPGDSDGDGDDDNDGDNSATTNRAVLNAEDRAALDHARQQTEAHRSGLIRQLTANCAAAQRQATAEVYANLPIDQLEVLVDSLPRQRQGIFAPGGAVGSGLTGNERKEVLDLDAAREKYDPLILNAKKAGA